MYYDFERILENARTLSDPTAAECFFYSDYCDYAYEVQEEIEELRSRLPEGISLEDLPYVYCGNSRTKVFGCATCRGTNGHLITEKDPPNRVIFQDDDEALAAGYRPCGKCMPMEYHMWMGKHGK